MNENMILKMFKTVDENEREREKCSTAQNVKHTENNSTK